MIDAERLRARLLLWRHFPRVLRLAARQRGRAAAGIALGVLAGLLVLGFPYAIKVFEENVLRGGNLALLPSLAALVAAIIALRAACDGGRAVLLTRARAETTAALRLDLHSRILHAPLPEIESRKSAALHDRLMQDLEAVTGLLYSAGPTFVHSFAVFIGAAVYCFSRNWKLALLGMMALPPFLIVSLVWVRRLRPRYKALYEQRSQLGATLQQHYAGARTLKSFARERWAVENAAQEQADLVEQTMSLARRQALLAIAASLVAGAGLVAVLWYGSRLVHGGGGMTSGELMELFAVLVILAMSVNSLVGVANAIQQSLASAERIFELSDLPTEGGAPRAEDPGAKAPLGQADLEIRGLAFAFPGRDDPEGGAGAPVLRGLSLRLPAGGVVALVGASGAGKTTTAGLVMRLLKPDAGAILWGGVNVDSFPVETWRRSLAVVHQEDWLLAATIRENLVLGRGDIGEEEIARALVLASARDLVASLPDELDTEVGERGHTLSGGERQRICLARAFLGEPRLLILDEATAALDLKTEAEIFSNLRGLPGGPSVLLISHRLSAVRVADRISFLENGRIVEEGCHEDLMKRGERYAEAFLLQTARRGSGGTET